MVESRSKSLPDPLVPPLGDTEGILDVIAVSTGEPVSTVRQRLLDEERQLGKAVQQEFDRRGLTPYVWSDQLVAFYEQSDAFVYESVVWNRTAAKLGMRRWIGRYLANSTGPQRVLLYGDGLGFDSAYLSLCGHQVAYFEVSERCNRFAAEVFARSGAEVTTIDDESGLADGQYDVVVCLDVLEHVPDPPQLVARFASLLPPGGRLIVHAPFFFLHPCVSTHLASNRRYSGEIAKLYRQHGFAPIDGRFFWFPLVLARTDGEGFPAQRGFWTASKLWLSGMLLRGARVWSGPYSWFARQTSRRDRRWREELVRMPSM